MHCLFLFVLSLILSLSAAAAQEIMHPQPFSEWLEEFKRDALSQGILQATLDEAFVDTEPLERVIELDRKQPESTLTLEEYLEKIVTDTRVATGQAMLNEHRALLEDIGKKYGVQPRFIVALWGIETNFGNSTGGFFLVDALATLAYDGRRSDYFRSELVNMLKIAQEEEISASTMQGSWAGAMGQCQFMPSSYLQFAVDHDQDGRRDIWDTPADIFASIANYLSTSGWDDTVEWGMPVKLPVNFDKALADIKEEKPLSEWQRLGVRQLNGENLSERDISTSLILVGEDEQVPYIIYGNYKVLLKWNRSRYFATAVGLLADRIGH